MIKETKSYYIVCDRCGKRLEDDDYGICGWADKGTAVDEAEERDWLCTKDGFHYCPVCISRDEKMNEYYDELKDE